MTGIIKSVTYRILIARIKDQTGLLRVRYGYFLRKKGKKDITATNMTAARFKKTLIV